MTQVKQISQFPTLVAAHQAEVRDPPVGHGPQVENRWLIGLIFFFFNPTGIDSDSYSSRQCVCYRFQTYRRVHTDIQNMTGNDVRLQTGGGDDNDGDGDDAAAAADDEDDGSGDDVDDDVDNDDDDDDEDG